jgi:hypothetical protein
VTTYYCDQAAVTDLLVWQTGGFSATTHPTSTQVDDFIISIDTEIRGVLHGCGYTPSAITDADALRRLQDICAAGVAAKVIRSMQSMDPAEAKVWEDIYQAGLRQIRSNEIPGMPSSGAASLTPRSYYTYNPTEYPDPTFVIGERQW